MKNATIITLLIMGAVVVVGALYIADISNDWKRSGLNASDIASIEPGSGAAYTDLGGATVDLFSFEGRTLVINSWASWSPYSVQELRDLSAIAREYKERGVTVIAMNRKEDRYVAEAFLSTVGPLSDLIILLDPDDRFYGSLDGFAMPETVFYDRHGNISYHHRGVLSLDDMRGYLEEALRETE